ncbi:Ribosomal RNA small subunit methyltransferase [Dirofilaria immitis]
MPDDEYRKKYSAAQKMQLLKSQQAKLEIRAMPAHSQLKLKEYDKKMKKKRKKKITKKKSGKIKLSLDPADSSSSSLSKLSLASSGSGAAIPRSSSHKSDVQHPVPKDEQENVLKWKRRTEYIYEAERISIKLKEIATECEKDITLRLAMDDIATRMDTLKKAHDEYYQYVQAQNDIFDKQIKLLDEIQAMQITELTNKIHRLSNIFKNIDTKLSVINDKLRNVANHQAQKTLMQNFIGITCTIF